MSSEVPAVPAEPSGRLSSVTLEGITVVSNSETEDEIRDNFAGEPKPKDGEAPDPEKEEAQRVSKAASELGKRGAEAKRAKAERDEPLADDGEEPAAAKEADEPAKPLGKPRDDPRARVLEAARKEKEARAEATKVKAERDALKAERDALQARLEAPPPAKEAPKEGKPVRAQFANDEEWVEAIADWKADEKVKAVETKREQETKVRDYRQFIQERLDRWAAARKEYEKTDPAYMDKVSDSIKKLVPSFALMPGTKADAKTVLADEFILLDEKDPNAALGTRLMVHLSEHPEELDRLLALDSYQDVQVEARLLARSLKPTAAPKADKPEISKARPPIRPVSGSSVAPEDDLSDDLSTDDYLKRANAKYGTRAGRKR